MFRTISGAVRIAGLGLAAMMLVGASHPPKIGQPAPDFEMTLVDGSKVRLADLKGQVVVINFWATWCVPCRKELPELDAYYDAHKAQGLRVFAVTTEDSVPLFRLQKLFSVMKMSAARAVKGPYKTLDAVPTNYVIDRAGIVRFAKAAAFDRADLDTVLRPLLQQDAPAAEPVPAGTR